MFLGMKRPGIPAELERASSSVESASTTDQHQSVTCPAETECSGPSSVHGVCCALREGVLTQLAYVGRLGGWHTLHEAAFSPG